MTPTWDVPNNCVGAREEQMKPLERMTPTEYVDFMWAEFNKAVGGDDLARWREPSHVSSIKFPFDNLLTRDNILDRDKAITNALKK